LSVYESRIWRLGRTLLPQSVRLKLRIPVVKLIVLYRSVVLKSYSANGEDLFIRSLIGDRRAVWYFDVGAGDPKLHSNTYGFYLRGAEGVAIDANKDLLTKYGKARPRDTTIWGAITRDSDLTGFATYWRLDPWELSTTDRSAMERAVKNGARILSEDRFPAVDVNGILGSTFPRDDRVTLLNVDIEGISFEVLNGIDFTRFPFDYILVERDSVVDTFERAQSGSAPGSFMMVGSLGPTDAYARVGAEGSNTAQLDTPRRAS
jgi:hypothetical protein